MATPSGHIGLPNPACLLGGLLLVSLTLGACSIPIPSPLRADSPAIGISIREWWAPREWLEEHPEMGYFIRLNEAGNVTAPIEIIRSNYFRKHRLYLLNAKPGRYALVATSEFARLGVRKQFPVRRFHRRQPGGFPARRPLRPHDPGQGAAVVFGGNGGGFQPRWNLFPGMEFLKMVRALSTRRAFYPRRDWGVLPAFHGMDSLDSNYLIYTTYFSQPMILKTVVEVVPGRFSVMGAFQVRRHRGMSKADPAQKFYHGAIQTDKVDPRGMPIFNSRDDFSIPSLGEMKEARGGAAAEKLFLREALEDFRGTAWEGLVRRALAGEG